MPRPHSRLATIPYKEWPDHVTPSEVASLFRVDPKTVTRWASDGKIPEDKQMRTAGNHRRFERAHIWYLYTGREPDEES